MKDETEVGMECLVRCTAWVRVSVREGAPSDRDTILLAADTAVRRNAASSENIEAEVVLRERAVCGEQGKIMSTERNDPKDGTPSPERLDSDCVCVNWASTDPLRVSILTGHHPRCPHAPDKFDAACKLIHELVYGIERWAAEEDGVYPDVWDAYRKAKALQGVVLPADPNASGEGRRGETHEK